MKKILIFLFSILIFVEQSVTVRADAIQDIVNIGVFNNFAKKCERTVHMMKACCGLIVFCCIVDTIIIVDGYSGNNLHSYLEHLLKMMK